MEEDLPLVWQYFKEKLPLSSELFSGVKDSSLMLPSTHSPQLDLKELLSKEEVPDN